MGMKQRLGLALALLNNPDVLILDEPANGLDPAGIVEMRDLLRDLAGQGKTVFISSHVLTEVQQICTRVAIINHGKLIRVAPVHDLLKSTGEFAVKVDSPAELLATLRLQPWAQQARTEDGLVITRAPDGRGRNLIKFLVESGHTPDSVSERQTDLEDIFLSLTGGNS
jgi:ABC-2 type transport system ATP-binding protein